MILTLQTRLFTQDKFKQIFYDWNLKDYPFDVQELKFEIRPISTQALLGLVNQIFTSLRSKMSKV